LSKRVGLRYIGSAGGKKPLDPSAFNYDNLVGKIWMEDTSQYSYDEREDGTTPIEVREPYGTSPAGDLNGGSYDNRE